MKLVTFLNFTDEDFTYAWNSEPHTIKAGQSVEMEDWRANHAAKHLVNRELNKANLAQFCSPKVPKDVPQFYERYLQAVKEHTDSVDFRPENAAMAVANSKPKTKAVKEKPVKAKLAPVDEEFEGLKE